jgi:hypothetical protein
MDHLILAATSIDLASYTPKIFAKERQGSHIARANPEMRVGESALVGGLAISARDTAICLLRRVSALIVD